jgi:hypothetical protein
MIRKLLESLERNPVFSGGLTLMLIGSAAALLRKFPAQLWSFVERRLSISLKAHRRAARRGPCILVSSDPRREHPDGAQ